MASTRTRNASQDASEVPTGHVVTCTRCGEFTKVPPGVGVDRVGLHRFTCSACGVVTKDLPHVFVREGVKLAASGA